MNVVQGSSEQRTESYYTYDEGVVAGDNTEIHKKSAPKSNGEIDKVARRNENRRDSGLSGMICYENLKHGLSHTSWYGEGVLENSTTQIVQRNRITIKPQNLSQLQ